MAAVPVGQDAGYNLRAGGRRCFSCAVSVVTIPGLLHALLLDVFSRELRASFVARMWSTQRNLLCLAFHLTVVAGAINHDAEPYVIAMVNNASMGPDGMYTSDDCCKSTY